MITCPECKHEFSPDESLKHHLDHLMKEERAALATSYETKMTDLSKREASIDQLVDEKLKVREARLKSEVTKEIRSDYATEIDELRKQVEEKQAKATKVIGLQLELEKIKRERTEREDSIKLEYEKKLSGELTKMESIIAERTSQQYELKIAEREKQLSDLRKQLDEAKRKAEQGSVQTQGEVQELVLEELLTELFRFDSIQAVTKGQNGADILQVVRTQYGKDCGLIAYESKRTKNFSEGWISKLKDDMREHGANHGIIVTEAMPKDMPAFGLRNGIWICAYKDVAGLAAAIRQICLTEANIKATEVNRAEKIQALYNYLMSSDFKQRVEAIIENVGTMRENIDRERKSMLAFWKKQEKAIEQMGYLFIDIVGSIDGISGNALGPIRGLQLEQSDEAA